MIEPTSNDQMGGKRTPDRPPGKTTHWSSTCGASRPSYPMLPAGWLMWAGQLLIVASGVGVVALIKAKLAWSLEPPVPMLALASICVPAFAFCLAYYAWAWSWSRQAARRWSQNVATIIRSERRFVSIDVEYAFDLEGDTYISDRVRFGMIIWSEQQAIREAYSVGTRVRVYYDPEAPSRSCLQTNGLPAELLLPVHLGAFFFVGIPFGLLG